jgi:hypothetical protein
MTVEQNHNSAKEAAEKVATELKMLAQSLSRATSRILSSTGIPELARTMSDVAKTLQRVEQLSEAFLPVLRAVQEKADAEFSELEADLRDALRAKGWQCDGQWPNFIVERALDVKIDESNRSAQVAGRKIPSANVTSIVEALTSDVSGLLPKGFDPVQFLEQVAVAYDAAQAGAPTALILDVYRAYVITQQKANFWRNAVGSKFEGVSADQFRARLARLLEKGAITSKDGRSLRLLPPLDPKDALLVFQPSEHRFAFVGRIEFVKEA